ncbi:uncharacterized protein METZ01_LOCUS241751 [marine metagenome]|uniref:Uncharacterized protein n=1 Tax=marine metagenome TaxID=408172 RepID=A0A382HPL5_9ZZZZ
MSLRLGLLYEWNREGFHDRPIVKPEG